uniref:Triacylglycerol lipase n=1 Tax=Panagrolaimus sp. PS1159 TaxID=55785 RepID=A0AC35GJN7_9BILA
MVNKFGVLLFVLLCSLIASELTPDFLSFISRNYGNGVAVSLDRIDMGGGSMGSFGGKSSRNEVIRHKPIIFIHGVTLRAGIFVPHVEYFLSKGYNRSELYSTTYGDGGRTPMFNKDMECADVKQVRNFIKAVYDYTGSQVNVLGYSMGVAITRKAILGGYCVDTNEYLAYGLEKCTPNYNACNVNNGMYCDSDYMKDVNKPNERYEGKYSYYIYSESDYVIGKSCCGNFCPELKNAYGVSAHQQLDHGTALTMTKDIQYAMIKHENFDHIVPKFN